MKLRNGVPRFRIRAKKRIYKWERNPLNEGSLAKILELLRPWLNMRPAGVPFQIWIERLFHVDERVITAYVTTEEFKMPGLLKVLPLKPIQGYGYRTVRAESPVWVRTDSTEPDKIDVEVTNGPGHAEQVFQLSASEFRAIRRHLNKAPLDLSKRCGHKRRPTGTRFRD